MWLDFEKYTIPEILEQLTAFPSLPEHLRSVQNFLTKWNTESPFFEVQTSGSVSVPQNFLLEKNKAIRSAKRLLDFLQIHPGETGLFCLPANYIAGKMFLVRAVVGKLRLYCEFPSETIPKGNFVFDFSAWVPAQAYKNLNRISRIRKLLLGGGPLHEELEQKICVFNPETRVTYGMTETYTQVALRKVSSGKEKFFEGLPGVRFETDDQSRLKIFTEIAIQSPVLTDDLVELFDNQKFLWKGRFGNVILTGGLKLIPERIEAKISGSILPTFFVAGIPDPKWGNRVVLLIEGGENRSVIDIERICTILQEKLSGSERPKIIGIVKNFSYTSSGKIQRSRTLQNLPAGFWKNSKACFPVQTIQNSN